MPRPKIHGPDRGGGAVAVSFAHNRATNLLL